MAGRNRKVKNIIFNEKVKGKISLFIGVIGALLLFFHWGCLCHLGDCYPKILKPILGKIGDFCTAPSKKISFSIWIIFAGLIGFAFIPVFLLSFIGIWFGFRGLSSHHRAFAILGFILNSLNLLLSLFIAWLLFGLARGM